MKSSPDDFELDVEFSDSTQAPTRVYLAASRPRRIVAGSVVVTLILAAVFMWSIRQAEPPSPPVIDYNPVIADAPAVAPTPLAAPRVEGAATRTHTIELPRPRRLPTLLSRTVGEIRRGTAIHPLRLGDALGDGLTVVNFWATYCEPCVRELPVFQTLAIQDRWRARDVRFLAVMVDQLRPDDTVQSAVLAGLRTVAASTRLLVDPGDELNGALRADGVYAGDAVLPVTLVFSCDELAWLQLGEMNPSQLSDVVTQLRRAPRCEGPPRTVPLPTPSRATQATEPTIRSCGDGRCDRTAAETCASCRADCACSLGTSCILNASGNTHCARDENALKD